MPDLKGQIAALVKLQELDSRIYALNNEKAGKPLEVKAVEEAFEAKKQNLANLEKESLELQKQRKEKELELAANAEAVKKLQGQLYSLKTNKEFQAMLQQIADTKADGSLIEEKILVSFEDSDKLKVKVEEEKNRLKEEEKKFLEQKKAVESREKEIDDILKQLQAQREQAVQGVDAKILSEYERILSSRDGLAIVGVINNSCGGCHMSLPPQVINSIKMYEHIVTCEVCNRIFYIPE
ncbi:MAG: C4-type zinc ribbon domain-containing protein [Candidatus Omnitrophica bacterium]|nr:C4-type zinc ribbon domain-containing protein [Candidatus Omnitrophota bacterium]MDD5042932.1 C4-type zinc ribbon domain-containing protein [Candidatus Omnitrophota bacterium]MDD5501453.1 C4-type zinc ribbon domain-containing protein [Candidatus Omnitrophota bacterium]